MNGEDSLPEEVAAEFLLVFAEDQDERSRLREASGFAGVLRDRKDDLELRGVVAAIETEGLQYSTYFLGLLRGLVEDALPSAGDGEEEWLRRHLLGVDLVELLLRDVAAQAMVRDEGDRECFVGEAEMTCERGLFGGNTRSCTTEVRVLVLACGEADEIVGVVKPCRQCHRVVAGRERGCDADGLGTDERDTPRGS